MRKVRVLIVDDSVVIRQLVSKVLSEDPYVEVVGTAANGRIALSKVAQLRPDLVTLDVEMPEMDGLETLAALRRTDPHLPVIMFSSATERGAATTLEALALGAADYVTKPMHTRSVAEALQRVRDDLVPRIRALCGKVAGVPAEPSRAASPSPRRAPVPALPQGAPGRSFALLAIGSSTGGPNALADVLQTLLPNFPLPMVIVQHMPPIFTKLLADRLTAKSSLQVREACDGDPLVPGQALLAPGNYHMALCQDGGRVRVQLHQGPQENSCRPSVDVLFRSAAEVYGERTLAVVLTGMGQDGLRGCQEIRAAGGYIIVQDEQSSVVWGMPGAVASAGLADRILPVGQIGAELGRRALEGRAARSIPPQPAAPNGSLS